MSRRLLFLLFFVSGITGLVYQVAWLRVLGLIFGNTTEAAATVVGAYMAGLGLGAHFFGRRIDRGGNPIRLYGVLEAGVAAWAFATPFLWEAIEWFYLVAQPAVPASLLGVLKIAVAFLVLVPPTALMGGTLPVLTRHVVNRPEEIANRLGHLYGWNTLGAVLGVLLTGFVALHAVGVWQTVILAGLANLMVAGIAWRAAGETLVGDETRPPARTNGFLLLLFGLSGAVAMSSEIAWTRVLGMVVGSSIQAFSIMLATFLVGLALGSLGFAWWARSHRVNLFDFALLELLTAAAAFSTIGLCDDIPWWFSRAWDWSAGHPWLLEPLRSPSAVSSSFHRPSGSAQPFPHSSTAIPAATSAQTWAARTSPTASAASPVPSERISSSFPGSGSRPPSSPALASARQSGSLRSSQTRPRPRPWALAAAFAPVLLAGTTVETWNRTLMTSGIVVGLEHYSKLDRGEFDRQMVESRPLFYSEGREFTVSVSRHRDTTALAINGKTDASTGRDVFTQYLVGHLPLLLHPAPERVLVVGLASGSTLAAVARHPVEKIVCAEIEAAMIPASEFFLAANRDVLRDPRLDLRITDARNHLLAHGPDYDVIVSEPSNPWIAGVASLFSLEYFQLMEKRLAEGGVASIWLQAYNLAPRDLQMVVRTFTSVFPNCSMWTSIYPDLILIGRREPGPVDLDAMTAAFSTDGFLDDFRVHGVDSPEALMAHHLLGDTELRALAAPAPVDSDNHPRLEFSAPRSLYTDTFVANRELIGKFATGVPPETIGSSPARLLAGIARGQMAQKRESEAVANSVRALELDPIDPIVLATRGRSLYAMADPDGAAPLLLAAARESPADPGIQYHLARNLWALGFGEQARTAIRRSLELDPARIEAWRWLARTTTDPGERLAALERVLDLTDGDHATARDAIEAAFRLDDDRRIEDLSSRLLAMYPRSAEIHEDLGIGFETRGQLDRALDVYLQLASLFPQEAAAHLNLARIYNLIGREDDAERARKKIDELDPSFHKALEP